MAIGERINYFRILRGMTQKALGIKVGFPESNADVRLAQYETGTRKPKKEITERLAEALDVTTSALNVPDIDSFFGLMQTFFAVEDIYGLTIDKIEGQLCLRLDESKEATYLSLFTMMNTWQEQKAKLDSGEITKEEYDKFRYGYPWTDKTGAWRRDGFNFMNPSFIRSASQDEDE